MALYKQCSCGELIPIDSKCDTCNSERSKNKYNYEKSNYKRLYHTIKWQRLRDSIRIKFKYMCLCCWNDVKIKDVKIVHHINEANEDNFFNKDNLILLCHECHEKIHSRYESSIDENRKCKKELVAIKERFEEELG